jgi:Divergent InlB B-repeat domain
MRKGLVMVVFALALWSAPGAFAAGWCGGSTEAAADRPDVATGQQLHAVVAIPSDGVDTFPSEAARLADDIASISAWWQGQDPTRIPRFDQAVFGPSTCADISFVKLASSGATYSAAGASGAFQRVSSELGQGGLGSIYKKYLVYYAGPSVATNVCGTGGGDFDSGRSYAIIWLRECPDVPSDTVAAHELLHAFGALPLGARHPCPPSGGGSGHPCDSPTDILYPYASGGPLTSLVLDFNHDDYYAHPDSDPWLDIQDSHWLHRLDLGQVPLGVSLSGGPGTITSDLPGVACTATCTTQWDQGTEVRLTAVPAASDRFIRWSGSCTGNADCVLTLSQAATATAVFGPVRIPVRLAVTGKGRIACTPRCGNTVPGGEPLSLRALPTKGWKFARWSGACKGARPVCRPVTTYSVVARAFFTKKR